MQLSNRKDNPIFVRRNTTMKKLNTVTKIVAKILEVVHWLAAAFMAVAAICSAAGAGWLENLANANGMQAENASVYGFDVNLLDASGKVNKTSLLLFALAAVLIFLLMAMVFRNIYLIIKNSVGTTPFQKDNVRMVREIGIFSIAIPVIGLIMSVIIRLAVGAETAEISVNLDGFVMGIVLLCLSQVFAYGVGIEEDVDGLL